MFNKHIKTREYAITGYQYCYGSGAALVRVEWEDGMMPARWEMETTLLYEIKNTNIIYTHLFSTTSVMIEILYGL